MTHNTIKSTRFQSMVVLFVTTTVFLNTGSLTGAEWIDMVKWIFGIYAFSEVGAKGAVAYRDRHDLDN